MGSRWAVTGSQGQLGRALVSHLSVAPGCEIVAAAAHADLDVSDEAALRRFFDGLPSAPDVLVNAAAFTHVDRCEREPVAAHRVNAAAPTLLASQCRERGMRLVHVSTDYVFDGRGSCPYREDDAPAPRSAYGRTKLEGERGVLEASDAFLVVRTSWVYGQGRNFVEAILSQAEARRNGSAVGPMRVVDDQWGQPTYALDLAPALCELAAAGARGVVHVTGGGVATWWDVARAALDEAGYPDLAVDRIATSALDLDAARPAWSVLDCSRAESLGVSLRAWREALANYLRCRAPEYR